MMELLALKCPTCGQNLKPQSNDAVVVSCGNCRTAVSLHQSGVKAHRRAVCRPQLRQRRHLAAHVGLQR